jgi:hypothetical protein
VAPAPSTASDHLTIISRDGALYMHFRGQHWLNVAIVFTHEVILHQIQKVLDADSCPSLIDGLPGVARYLPAPAMHTKSAPNHQNAFKKSWIHKKLH